MVWCGGGVVWCAAAAARRSVAHKLAAVSRPDWSHVCRVPGCGVLCPRLVCVLCSWLVQGACGPPAHRRAGAAASLGHIAVPEWLTPAASVLMHEITSQGLRLSRPGVRRCVCPGQVVRETLLGKHCAVTCACVRACVCVRVRVHVRVRVCVCVCVWVCGDKEEEAPTQILLGSRLTSIRYWPWRGLGASTLLGLLCAKGCHCNWESRLVHTRLAQCRRRSARRSPWPYLT